MELNEFRAKVFELLEKNGYKEIDGELYYPQESIISMMEWFYEESGIITEARAEQLIGEMLERVFAKWADPEGNSPDPPAT